MAVALLAPAAGCGQQDQTGGGVASVKGTSAAARPSASPSADREEQGRKFAQCMRDHGVDMPDPQADANGRMSLRLDSKGGTAKIDEAMKACQSLSPFGDKGRALTPEQQDQARAFAQCMRDNGVDMPDPDFSGGTVKIGGPGMKINADDPKFTKAMEACRDKMTAIGGKR
ncbi:hypothetical protein Pth03_55460 [Planotetraspora thailandica]|uniref:Uncharacterized protein n=1 Tax=Planotetraspora thailandica TaxID=487172 RepID=A0A8J3XW28_9ACTN|nr:hypothetical protein Pth03_55460 [Planotetraspora thailandica]